MTEKVDGEKKKRKQTVRGRTLRALEKAERMLALGSFNPWGVAPRYARAQALVRAALVAIAVKDESVEFKELASDADRYLDTFEADTITTRGERLPYSEFHHPERVPDSRGRPMTEARSVRGSVWLEASRIAWQIEIGIDSLEIDDDRQLAEWFLVQLGDCPRLRERMTARPSVAKLTWGIAPFFEPDRDWSVESRSTRELAAFAQSLALTVGEEFSRVRLRRPNCSASELSELFVMAGLKVCGYPNPRDVFSGRRKQDKRTGHLYERNGAPATPRPRRPKRPE